ncbi:MAG: hypothetical protein A4S09_05935 [Proteobacteria bacterium SG_bin7]|nr:MAG: hypothetical protein A4S09_05935 [Proteobacteria bacterium SG_bin7]
MLNKVIANALDAVIGINGKSEIIFWNSQAEVTFGWSRNDVINRMSVVDIIPQRYRADHLEGMRNYLATGEGKIILKRLELSGLHQNGHEFPLELTIIPIDAEQPLFYAFVRDITDRVSRHQELLDVIRERDFFISVASHELKTPLTSLKLRIQLLDMLLKEPGGIQDQEEEIHKSVSVCSRQVDKLASMCNDLLDLAKIQSRKMEISFRTFKLRSLLVDILERMEGEVKSAAITVTLNISEVLEVRWDMARIEQVFVNLISNVLKYAPGKTLEIKCDTAEEFVKLEFVDSGPGITEENQKRLFNPFSRCASKYSTGLGLGLFICKGIIEQHRGKISVQSRVNEGTKFILELPRVLDSSMRGKPLR